MDIYKDILSMEEEQQESAALFNYHNIVKDDMNNGDGLRVVLFLSGCSHRCPKCQNPETWSGTSGIPFTAWDKAELYEALNREWIQGITFSGGDPLFKWNREGVGNIITDIKKTFPDKDIWLYTGYVLEQDEGGGFFFLDKSPWLPEHDTFLLPWLKDIDVLVDGPYMDNVRTNDLKLKTDPYWRGSSNQRVIDVKKSLLEGRIVLHCG